MCQKKSLIFFRYAGFQARLFDNSGFDTIDLYKRFPVLLMVMWFWVGVLMALWDWVLCYRRIFAGAALCREPFMFHISTQTRIKSKILSTKSLCTVDIGCLDRIHSKVKGIRY